MELEYEINERKRVEAALREKKELLSNILAGSAVGIGVVEDRKLSWTNESMMKMFGVENKEDYIGQSAKILYASEEEYERVGQILFWIYHGESMRKWHLKDTYIKLIVFVASKPQDYTDFHEKTIIYITLTLARQVWLQG